jgi:uncharacterized LabA/DUF88 family protein
MFHPTETTAAFIDGPNLHATARALNFEIDYRSLLTALQENGRLLRANYFTPIVADEDEQHVAIRPLVDWLQYNGWRVTTKPARTTTGEDGRQRLRGSIDVELTVAALKLAASIDHAVIFTGSRDFIPLVSHLQDVGVRVTIASSMKTPTPFVSDDLRRLADAFVDIEDLRHIIARPDRTTCAA